VKKLVLTVAMSALFASAAIAQDGYKFHIRVTDARTGLLANPRFAELKMPAEQLERAVLDRVMVLDHATGTHWVWLMLSWPEGKPTAEQGINAAGSATPGKNADLGLTPKAGGTISMRCFRQECRIRTTTTDKREATVLLKSGQSADFPLDSDINVVFAP
jgi:hypothetical protein